MRFAVEGMVWHYFVTYYVFAKQVQVWTFVIIIEGFVQDLLYTQRQLRVFRESHCSIQRFQQADIATFYLYSSFK